MATKQTPPSVDGAGSVLSSSGGPSDTTPPQSLGSSNDAAATLLRKVAASQALADAMPGNPNVAGQYGAAARTPQEGVHVSASDPAATGSTTGETTASPKTGNGQPALGANAGTAPLDRVRADDSGRVLTTNQGVPVGDNQNSLKAGLRGYTLMEDFILREKITHFDHERIPERVVHARGSAAHGYFECYKEQSDLTRASLFAKAGKRTPVFVRFSTVAGERGSTDTARDVRGFAVKFYTDEGNWDLVGNNMPVFFIQDAMKFPDLVHAVKPEPHNGIPQAASAHDTFWDFASLMPEITHMLMWAMSDRAIPRSYRTMQGFGVHTFRLVNAEGKSVFCKFHWSPMAGTHSLVWDEAVKISGADSDFHRRDLWEAIEAGAYPEWELALQVFTEEQAEAFEFDVLDPTKLIPEEMVPLTPVGKMVLNRNPDNFFAETEQVAFCTAHIVPGIDFSNDPLLQGRIHSYVDTQISRLGGANFHEIPINSPIAPLHNNQRDGMHRQAINRGRVAYEPNSLAGGAPFQAGGRGFNSFPQAADGDKVRGKPEKFAEHYGQARLFFISQTPPEQDHIVNAFRFELTKVQTVAIRKRIVAMLRNVDETLAQRVADGLGLALPPAMPTLDLVPIPDYAPAPSLSLTHRPGSTGIHTRRVAILVGPGVDAAQVRDIYGALLADGAVPRLVGSALGPVDTQAGAPLAVEVTLETAPGVLFDAVVIPDGAAAIEQLSLDANALDFVRQQYRHCKPLLVIDAGKALLDKAGVPLTLPDGSADPAIIIAAAGDAKAVAAFKQALAGQRAYARETDPPRV
ncbi:catalase [Janthinobacterium psychrotolerans]|uniref:Catalase n=1 Tax=Janthinobacterium psychrotolerans TaxID=1747903 RepID=A0A1A7C245_9BURK|nr:catalase [Janthinobacterium psychrotolerans]OBV39807.1 catalase [Janthinobacterium psychrotolerans]